MQDFVLVCLRLMGLVGVGLFLMLSVEQQVWVVVLRMGRLLGNGFFV